MNIKSITTLGLVAVAIAATAIAPAEANNNNAALNQMAMQMYMQNQATAAANANIYNPSLVNNYGYVAPWSTRTLPYGVAATNYGYNPAYNNIVAPQYTRLSQEAANISARLAAGNLSRWETMRLQAKLAKIQAQENSLAANGYGAPYGGGVFNNLRSRLGIY